MDVSAAESVPARKYGIEFDLAILISLLNAAKPTRFLDGNTTFDEFQRGIKI